ncbi:bifunctional phosphopantothenoylcysteine decarboxylase/phosphopantothenate--cysteine ligase CoaBC|uniref:Coenzyme A biosynthesis bifunctional protein CoaBC n=1 Tax=Dendrosporobacter quercicolus TaxID=146817 RepID=A0A1G9M4F8_9FIRM|nr:bifunctional phosphopantothenoylcysteine decarboxylase/phosphopantothenate--cysteine ligase CoaBC [Dendrosporobacter quercicolus]NSL46912.1 bifunctional phosphopantothenoylcysteine decarboxylase/phosphopantothenate--cysteine ligase CoaBC [Dendrosporobacter quercicolus DSM 1736]SDL69150.1 phosphopantothenoylcysteine decarboxylase / phosphopantothenate--cysteine ligase [Dendrosporobacter quercicolus]
MLKGKTIVIGVSGGIAVYKAVEVVSRLRKLGASLYVVMTRAATNFVTPVTFREMSGNPVIVDMWAEPKKWNVEHIALAAKADLFLVAPATANMIGKVANGIADDMLTTTLMATKAPVVFAPAMNSNMYLNPIVQKNIGELTALGYQFIAPATGMLACGVEGPGRLPEPGVIAEKAIAVLTASPEFAGKKILVTAGGTIEPIDPVRYIGNRSSGKMGYALARNAAKRGGAVTLISGPTGLAAPEAVEVIRVETAAQMRTAVLTRFADADIIIKAAAVADYRPREVAPQKIKKAGEVLSITLEKNPDILTELGQIKRQRQILVGFAAETQNLIDNAREKIVRKNLDMIVANNVTLPGAGFNTDTNIVKLLYKDGNIEDLPKMSKDEVARIILDKIHQYCQTAY